LRVLFILMAFVSFGYLGLCLVRAFIEQIRSDQNSNVGAENAYVAPKKLNSNYWKRDSEEWEDKIMNDTNDTGLML
jgi:hypothetical protein